MGGVATLAVRCRGLAKDYGTEPTRVRALRGIDLDVPFGELLMLVGPSGCGKTTLLSILSGILSQDAGECQVLGHEASQMAEAERVRFRQGIGFVFQLFNLLPALTAEENVAVPLLIAGSPYREAIARAGRWVAAVGLEDRRGALPGHLSGGEQQRIAVARALVHDPRLVLCDEPTSNLDHQAGHDMMALLRNLTRAPNRTVIVVTHDSRILEFADRVARMDDGRLVDDGNGSALRGHG